MESDDPLSHADQEEKDSRQNAPDEHPQWLDIERTVLKEEKAH